MANRRLTAAQSEVKSTPESRRAALENLAKFFEELRQARMPNLRYVLPLVFNLKGSPYSLKDYMPFEPMFNTRMPRNLTIKSGRQVSKSTTLGSRGILFANTIPFYTQLFVTPLFEMIRRLSSNVVKPFIDDSPLRACWTGTHTENNVLQRSFTNRSKMIFSYAFLSPDRTRGISADELLIDEVQDMDPDFIPIMRETMSASQWGLTRMTGTPKTMENTIEGEWSESSQGEWVIPCHNCGYENVPALTHDLDDMIGPWHADISEDRPGVVCGRCKRNGVIMPIFPRLGRWRHRYPEKLFEYAGYHIPQIIMPLHYADRDKWGILLGKKAGMGNTAPNVFYNEVCGESYDAGAKLVTRTDLQLAGCLHENTLEEALKIPRSRHIHRVMGVDWGGGGEKRVSFTSIAIMGMLPNGNLECIYGWRSMTPHDYIGEAQQILGLMERFRCSHILHDYNGSGEGRGIILTQSGLPVDRLVPISYIRAASGAIFRFIEEDGSGQRAHFRADKARSLHLICQMIKTGLITFFKYDFKSKDDPGLLEDFLALVEDKVDGRSANDLYTIIRDTSTKKPDDFAQAVNYAALGLFHMSGTWPNIAEAAQFKATYEQLSAMDPINPNWDD